MASFFKRASMPYIALTVCSLIHASRARSLVHYAPAAMNGAPLARCVHSMHVVRYAFAVYSSACRVTFIPLYAPHTKRFFRPIFLLFFLSFFSFRTHIYHTHHSVVYAGVILYTGMVSASAKAIRCQYNDMLNYDIRSLLNLIPCAFISK